MRTFCGKKNLCFTISPVGPSLRNKFAKGSKLHSKKAPPPVPNKIYKSISKNSKNWPRYNNPKTKKPNDLPKIKRKENIINQRASHIPMNFFLIDLYFYFEGKHFNFWLKYFSFYKFFKYLMKSSLFAYVWKASFWLTKMFDGVLGFMSNVFFYLRPNLLFIFSWITSTFWIYPNSFFIEFLFFDILIALKLEFLGPPKALLLNEKLLKGLSLSSIEVFSPDYFSAAYEWNFRLGLSLSFVFWGATLFQGTRPVNYCEARLGSLNRSWFSRLIYDLFSLCCSIE